MTPGLFDRLSIPNVEITSFHLALYFLCRFLFFAGFHSCNLNFNVAFFKFHILFAWGHIDPMKELSVSLIVSQAKYRLVTPQTPQVVKQIICSFGILPESPPAV